MNNIKWINNSTAHWFLVAKKNSIIFMPEMAVKKVLKSWGSILLFMIFNLTLVTWTTFSRAETTYIGYVLGLEGKGAWLLATENVNSEQNLKIGMSLPADGVIKIDPNAQSKSKLLLYLSNGSVINCTFEGKDANSSPGCTCPGQADRCPGPLKLPSAFQPEITWITRMQTGIQMLFNQKTKRYAVSLARGRQFSSDVVLMDNSYGTNIAPALTKLPAGRYQFDFRSISGKESETDRVEVIWSGNPNDKLYVSNLVPSLYSARVAWINNGVKERLGGNSWFLIVNSEHFDATNEKYSKMKHMTVGWPKQVSAKVKKTYLRAVMDVLSQNDQF